MANENVDSVKNLAYDHDLGEVKPRADMNITPEPSTDESTGEVEDTTVKNETEAPEVHEEGGEAKHSSRTISDLGEDRKKLAGELVSLAQSSPVAAQKLKTMCESDPRLDRLIKTKYGTTYDQIKSGELKTSETEFDQAKFEEEALIRAKVQIYAEEDERLKGQQLNVFAKTHGLNTDEVEVLKKNVAILEPHYGHELALDKGLLLVSRDKASAANKGLKMPTGGTVMPSHEVAETFNPALIDELRKADPDRSREDIIKSLGRHKGRIEQRGNETYYNVVN